MLQKDTNIFEIGATWLEKNACYIPFRSKDVKLTTTRMQCCTGPTVLQVGLGFQAGNRLQPGDNPSRVTAKQDTKTCC